jgi:hypothetical protein
MDVHWLVQISIACLLQNNCTIFKAMLVCLYNTAFFKILFLLCYLVISSVSPNTGSTQGGTTLTINGQFFCDNAAYPLVVNVGGQTCTIINASLTTVLCQTSAIPTSNSSQYQGTCGRRQSYFLLEENS